MKTALRSLCCVAAVAQFTPAADLPVALRQAFERTAYALKDSGDGTWRGENRAQRLALEFDSTAARLVHPDGSVGFHLTGFGYGNRLIKPAPALLTAIENRLEYRRGDVTEWYVNGSHGLEQGFTFARRLAGGIASEPLTIVLGVTGDLALEQKDGAVLLRNGKNVVLSYAGLTAKDARGRTLPSRLEAGSHEIRLIVEDRHAQYPLVIDPTWSQQQELTASDGVTGDLIGQAVSVNGGLAAVAAGQRTVGMNVNQGAVFVFVQSGTTWTQQAELTASDGAEGDVFGQSVSLSGNTLVIGAPAHAVGTNTNQGAAYVFVQSGSAWTQQAELMGSDSTSNDGFGQSVSLSGSTVVIGAPGHTVSTNPFQGAAYVFVQSSGSWNQQAELTASDGVTSDNFGQSVSVSGSTALIGAYSRQVGSNSHQGAAYVFVQSGSTWSQQAELTASDGAAFDYFGGSVSVSGGLAVAGSYNHLIGENADQGAAWVFVQSGSSWSQQAELTADDGAEGDNFGTSVSISGTTLVIGSPSHQVGENEGQGAAYVYVQSGTTWSQQQELTASGGAASDNLGTSVSLSGSTVVSGAPYRNGTTGSAFVFVTVSPASLSISATHSSPIYQAGPGTITFTVANSGGSTSATATVSDTVSSDFTINSASSGCAISGQIVSCMLNSGASADSTVFTVFVTASSTASASISNTATLSDSGDTITSASGVDTIGVLTASPLVDSSFTQLVLSGFTDNGLCTDGNRTLTATDLLQNTGGSTLANPYAVIGTLSQGNTLLSQSASSRSVGANATVTLTFHIKLAGCSPFQLFFDVRAHDPG